MCPSRNLSPAASYLLAVGNQLRQPVFVLRHPPELAGLERRIAFVCARIVDAVGVEGRRLPFRAVELVHADRLAELLRQLGERGIAFL